MVQFKVHKAGRTFIWGEKGLLTESNESISAPTFLPKSTSLISIFHFLFNNCKN